jgi:hypothetical protein
MIGQNVSQNTSYWTRLFDNIDYFVNKFWTTNLASALTESPLPFEMPISLWVFGGLSWLSLGLIITILRFRSDTRLAFICSFYQIILLIQLVVMSGVGGLNRPWHFFILHPAFVLGVSVTAYMAVILFFAKFNFFVSIWVVASWIGLIGQGVVLSWTGLSLIQNVHGVNLTSPGLYAVRDFLINHQASRVICVSYSICHPLYALTEGKILTIDAAFDPLSLASWSWMQEFLKQPNTCIIYRRSISTAYTQGDWLKWLNRGSDWLSTLSVHENLKLIQFFDSRGTEFGIVYLEAQ